MAAVTDLVTTDLAKIIMIGESGSGKTVALYSLLEAGYKLRILDMDANVQSLVKWCQHYNPALLTNLDVIQLRDKKRASQSRGIEVAGQPKALVSALKAMEKWDDGTVPAQWGHDYVLVLDTLTKFGTAAFDWAVGMNPSSKDPRQWHSAAQPVVLGALEMFTSPEFNTNVIVISHIDMVDMQDGTTQGYVSSIGKAIGPKIPATYSTVVAVEKKGTGANIKRVIRTVPTSLLSLKNPSPWELEKELPVETGLATIFASLTGRDRVE